MSIINQMLQDLEKRHASGAERGALPNQVRVLPRAGKSAAPWWAIAVGAALALSAALAWQINRQSGQVTAVRITPLAALPAPIIARSSGPASRLALDLEHLPAIDAGKTPEQPGAESKVDRAVAEPAPPLKHANVAGATARAMPAATVIEKTKPPKRPAAAAVAAESVVRHTLATPAPKTEIPRAKQAAVEPVKFAPPAPALPAAAVLAAAKPVAPVARPPDKFVEPKAQAAPADSQIDKRAQQLTPQQLAENEYRDAVNFLNQGRTAEAQDGFRRALHHYSWHTGARQGLFGLLIEAQKSGEAEQVLLEGLKLNAHQPGFAMALARLQVDRGNTVAAVETMQRAAPAASGSPDYLAFLAALLQRQSRHAEAIDSYRAALRLAPGSGVWLMGLAISLQALNRNAEAQDAFRNAKATHTLNPELQAFVDQRMRQLQ